MDGLLLERQERSGKFFLLKLNIICIHKPKLFARRGKMPESSSPDQWTSFTMPLRESAPMPIPFDFVRFLTSSITFVAHLTQVSVHFDGRLLAKIRRERGAPQAIALRPNLKHDSSKATMRVSGIEATRRSIYRL